MTFDVAVVGAGLAGSLSASMLGRAGFNVALIDPHEVYPPDFRCEKMEGGHVEVLKKTGLADALLNIATPMNELWIARFGRLLDTKPFDQYGFRYEDMVNAFRATIPGQVTRICDKVKEIEQRDGHRLVKLHGGEPVEARLVVLSNGLNRVLSRSLGVQRNDIRQRFSICIGFDVEPAGSSEFGFRALQYNAELNSKNVGYICLFRIGREMRANLFVYHDMDSEVIAGFRNQPAQELKTLLPGLEKLIGSFRIVGPVRVRPTDIEAPCYDPRPGIVMVGDACFVPCPAAGRGTLKAIVDVERLCNHYAPRWLGAGGDIQAEHVAEFYRDECKTATDTHAYELALWLREQAMGSGLYWKADRWVRFTQRLCRGWIRHRSFAWASSATYKVQCRELPLIDSAA